MQTKTGDHGQRYEIRCRTKDGEELVVGWTDNDPQHMLRAATLAPFVERAWVVDRREQVKRLTEG